MCTMLTLLHGPSQRTGDGDAQRVRNVERDAERKREKGMQGRIRMRRVMRRGMRGGMGRPLAT